MSQTILVIDDNPETLQLTALILTRHGYHVRQALDGAKGIEMAVAAPPDLILLDIMMPGMDGFETCRQLRQHDQLKDVPVVMFTARSQASDRREAYAAGANEYIVKPLRPTVLTQYVQSTLETAISAQELTTTPTREKVVLGLMTVQAGMESGFIGINLAACLSELDCNVLLVNVASSEAIETGGWSRVQPFGATVTDVAGISAVEQVCQSWEHISADTTSQSPVKKSVIILNLDHLDYRELHQLSIPIDHLIICFPPHLAAMSKTQALLEELQNAQLFVAGLHALLINLQSERQLTKTTVTSLLQYPLLDIVNINAVDLAAAETTQQPFALLYPQHQAARQLRQIAIQLIEN